MVYARQPGQLAHIGIWAPYKEGGLDGTVIHVAGAPMARFFSVHWSTCEAASESGAAIPGFLRTQFMARRQGRRGGRVI